MSSGAGDGRPAAGRVAPIAAGLGIFSFACTVLTTLRADHFDDAFITYVFARSLAQGHGIAWVPGDAPFYGPTSIPWTLLLALAVHIGVPIMQASAWLGALGWAVAVGLLFALLADVMGVRAAAITGSLCAVSTLGPSLSLGMETGVFVALALGALLLAQRERLRGAIVIAAAAAAMRPEGVLLVALVSVQAAAGAPAGGWAARLKFVGSCAAPGYVLLASVWAAELAYFGTVLPEAIRAKSAYGCGVSGCFRLSRLLDAVAEQWGRPAGVIVLSLAAAGAARALVSPRGRRCLLFAWGTAYLVSFDAARAPDSPWYYAPMVPVLFALSGFAAASTASRLGRFLPTAAACALGLVLAIGVVQRVQLIAANPLGASTHTNEEKRHLAAAIQTDLAASGRASGTVLAFEVGYLGYSVPGRIYDLLGLVTPGFQPCLQHVDGSQVLADLRPDYVVLTDSRVYPASGCIYDAELLARAFDPIVSIPRVFGGHYLVYARRPG